MQRMRSSQSFSVSFLFQKKSKSSFLCTLGSLVTAVSSVLGAEPIVPRQARPELGPAFALEAMFKKEGT